MLMLTGGGVDDAWGIDMFPFYNEGARLVWYVSHMWSWGR